MKYLTKLAASLAVAATLTGAAAPLAHAEELFVVTLLGTGSPRPSPDRAGQSTLVEVAGQRLMFDMGRNNAVGLFRARIPLGSINAHFITHMHSDHINGLPDLWFTGTLGAPYGQRKTPFVVYGPDGTQDMMKNFYAAFSEDRRIRQADGDVSADAVSYKAYDIKPGVVYENNGVKVTAFTVFHGEKIKPAYGYKVEYKGRKVVMSGDTKYDKRVEEEATGADLLIHEVATFGANTEKILAANPAYRPVLDHHITPEEAGTLFAKARPKLAVYSHFVLPGGAISLTDASGEIIKLTRKNYGGPLVVGEDMMRFRVAEQGISIEMVK